MASEVLLDPYDIKSWSPLDSTSGGKKTWGELRKSVRDTMKLLTSLAGSVPSNFTFRTEHKRSRLYFLGVPSTRRENTLLFVDITEDEHDKFVLPWRPLIDHVQLSWSVGQLSKEEQLMRERKRLGSYGITSYDFAEEKGRFVFPANSGLFLCEDFTAELPCAPRMIETKCVGARLDPKICPSNPDYVAFINNGDIWITSLMLPEEIQLTHTQRNKDGGLEDNPITAGVPSFVVQEEFDRYTGYWWQPTAHRTDDGTQTLRILYEQVDESMVDILHIFGPTTGAECNGVDEYRYPRAGTLNAQSSLRLAEFQVDAVGFVSNSVVLKQLVEPLTAYCSWAEYLIRAGWTPDGKYVYAQLMSRNQQKLCMLLFPLECFVTEEQMDTFDFQPAKYPAPQCIYQETSDVWINVHDVIHFFPQMFENQISFLWSSQKSGYRHLYHVTSHLSLTHDSPEEVDMEERPPSGCLQCKVLREVQLTTGEWEVLGKSIWVDESKGVVYFMGLKDTPLESHLYMVSYVTPAEPLRLTEAGYSHTVTLSPDHSLFVTTYSSVETPPQSAVCKIELDVQGAVSAPVCSILMEPPICPNYRAPELFQYESTSGYTMHGMFYRPHNYRPGVRYPTVLFVYGGPQVQLVTNSFKGLKFLRLHTLASQGYAVVMVDNRGSCNRGLAFEGCIKNNLGTLEINDQVEGLQWLAANVDFIDLSRVAIHGWSYGGYLALMGLAQRPEVFKVAIAGAPVVSWQLYDTGYTERYMSLPEENADGYRQGSVLTYLDRFPDEENRLLIVHGLIDENVHFHHTNQLVTALVKACKPHRLQVYPNERHGIRSHESNEHYKTLVLSFLQDNL